MEIIDKIDKEFFEGKLQPAFAAENCLLAACVENRCTRVRNVTFRKELIIMEQDATAVR